MLLFTILKEEATMYSKFLKEIRCLECGYAQPPQAYLANGCPNCQSGWLDAIYDYDAIKPIWQSGLEGREFSLWRYKELIPIKKTHPETSMNEGWTPLTRLYPYERIYNHKGKIYIKDERAEPTNSFKDRQAAMTVIALQQQEIKEIVLASTGNAAVAYAAYCARVGIKLWLFLTSLVPAEKMREAALYGCEVVKVSGTYDETKKVAAEFAHRKGIHFDKGAKSVPGKESMKTLGFEIAEQLGLIENDNQYGKWIAPDWYIQAVSGGIGPLGVWKGFQELFKMGLIEKMPKLGIVQAAGCAPMVKAFQDNQEKATAVIPQTLITVLATGDPGYSYELLNRAVRSNNGTMIAIEDGETFKAMRNIASKGGLSVEPATAVAFGGLEKMLSNGTIMPDEVVVVNCSGHTFTAESHILGDQYEQYILDLQISSAMGKTAIPQEEGLGGAIRNLDEQVTTIVIVDDNPNDRRLIRRLLQSYKRYRIYEASNGIEGLQVIKDRKPDIVVTDLTMPESDGFTLIENLKKDKETADIQVIVVSAKSLNEQDRETIEKYSASVWQKGGFDTHQLVDHVVKTLGHDPVPVGVTKATRAHNIQDDNHYTHTIVVIDDNPSDLRLARRIIQSGGSYNVIEAINGRDGLKAIYHYHPDLVILDLGLPDLDGFSILETLQKEPNLRDIPTIVYTARDLTSSERTKLEQYTRVFVHKSGVDRKLFLASIQKELK